MIELVLPCLLSLTQVTGIAMLSKCPTEAITQVDTKAPPPVDITALAGVDGVE